MDTPKQEPEAAPTPPPMHKQIAVRLIIGLLTIAALFFGYQKFAEFAKDPDLGDFDSAGMILAIAYEREGDRVVLLTEDGDEITPPEPEADANDRRRTVRDSEASWSADGQRVFMSSNRKSNSFTVHRWNPSNDTVDIKRQTSRFQSAPYFDPYNDPQASTNGLILSGGYVMDYEVASGGTTQILPPVLKDLVQRNDDQGTASPMDSLFENLGESFRKARWSSDRSAMFAIMKGDASDVAIFNLFPESGELAPPREIIRGDGVDLDVGPEGKAVVAVRRLFIKDEDRTRPEYQDENGNFRKPFESALILVTLGAENEPPNIQIVAAVNTLDQGFADPAISPDEESVVLVVGQFNEDGEFRPQGLVLMPLAPGGAQQGGILVQGVVRQPSWSPDGTQVTYIREDGNYSNVYVFDLDTGRETKVSPDGRYGYPKFSPQTASSSE